MLTIRNCPSTLLEGHKTFSRMALKRLFGGKRVSHLLPYQSNAVGSAVQPLFDQNRRVISLSGVQEKYSVLLDKNMLRLTRPDEKGIYILKPVPYGVQNASQMPANEHLTMQIARQVFGMEVAENTLVFFGDGTPAYLTKRFDYDASGAKLGQEDFASLALRTPQTHGESYKYIGHYAEMFEIMQKYLNTYRVDAPKLLKILIFNFLFSNGDAHFKNFSILETELGDYRLSPAYDLLNSRIHVKDTDFALDQGLLPSSMRRGQIATQFAKLADLAGISPQIFDQVMARMVSGNEQVQQLVSASFLSQSTQRNYLQHYQSRLKRLRKALND